MELVKLNTVMNRAPGNQSFAIGLIDGPVATGHPDLNQQSIRELSVRRSGTRTDSVACRHGTFTAGVFLAKGEASAFAQTDPSAEPEDIASAIHDCVDAGARLINLSVAITTALSNRNEQRLYEAIGYAAAGGVVIVAAAGNRNAIGGTAITTHPWVTSRPATFRGTGSRH